MITRRAVLLALLLLAASSQAAPAPAARAEDGTAAVRTDDFGDIDYEELDWRLDGIQVRLWRTPGARAVFVARRSARDLPGSSFQRLRYIKDYLTMYPGSYPVAEDRFAFRDAGVGPKLETECWVVPPGGADPPIAQSPAALPSGTFRYDVQYVADNEGLRLVPPELGNELGMVGGLGEILKAEPDARARLVVFAKRRSDVVGSRRAALAFVDARRRYLASTFGVSLERVRVRFGGYRGEGALELWLTRPRPAAAR